ncbi:MAG TPA: hypothetical protein VGF59_25735, partial [Bryobacteraceae bacterium]
MTDGVLRQAGTDRPGHGGGGPAGSPERVRRLHEVVRFAFPHRHAIAGILVLTLLVAGIGAIEPLILKALFDELARPQGYRPLLFIIGALLGLACSRHDLLR